MFLHAFYKTKKVSCILLAVLILWMTPACGYLDTAHMETVDAASVAVGVTAVSLLKVAAAAFGVVITTALTVKAVDAFTTWLQENGSQEDIELWNQADTDAPSFAYSESLTGKVGEWLRTQFTSLDSGEVTIAYGDGEITNGVPAVCPAAEESLRNNYLFPTIAKAPTYDHYIYMVNHESSGSIGRHYLYCFICDGSPYLFFYNSGFTYYFYDSVKGCYVRPISSSFRSYYFNPATLDSGLLSESSTMPYRVNFNGIYPAEPSYPAFRFVTNLPVIVTDLETRPGNNIYFSDLAPHILQTYNFNQEAMLTSYGNFSLENVNRLPALNLTADNISQIQDSVDQAAADHTSLDEEGNPVYAPDISQAIIDAYERGLEAAGAGTVDPDQPVDPDRPVDPEEPVIPPGDGILGFLQGLQDSLKAWITSIPDAVASAAASLKGALENGWTTLWGHLTGIGNTLMDLSGTVAAGFEQIVQGITDIPETLTGQFSDLQQWILDIPETLSAGFSDLQERIGEFSLTITDALADLAAAIPDAGAISGPITDAIADALTADPEVIQETVEAEKTDLWNLPFLTQAQELFDDFRFSAVVTYPKIKIETPAVLRPYYDQPEIILLDFEDYKDYCLWARLLFRAAIWLALVWHIVDLATPKLRIS